jgi:hypothetical protein
MGLLMASRVRRIDTRKRWHFWPVDSERVCNRTTETRIRQPARRCNARHTTLQFASISLALSLTVTWPAIGTLYGSSVRTRRAGSSPAISWRSVAGSVVLPQMIRCGPRSKTSPMRATAIAPASGERGPSSIASSASSRTMWSISSSVKPVISIGASVRISSANSILSSSRFHRPFSPDG